MSLKDRFTQVSTKSSLKDLNYAYGENESSWTFEEFELKDKSEIPYSKSTTSKGRGH